MMIGTEAYKKGYSDCERNPNGDPNPPSDYTSEQNNQYRLGFYHAYEDKIS